MPQAKHHTEMNKFIISLTKKKDLKIDSFIELNRVGYFFMLPAFYRDMVLYDTGTGRRCFTLTGLV